MSIKRWEPSHGTIQDVVEDPAGRFVRFADLPKWQPIETAPKEDEMDVLLLIKGRPTVGRYYVALGQRGCDSEFLDGDDATHWAPIPELPKPIP